MSLLDAYLGWVADHIYAYAPHLEREKVLVYSLFAGLIVIPTVVGLVVYGILCAI